MAQTNDGLCKYTVDSIRKYYFADSAIYSEGGETGFNRLVLPVAPANA
jgi:hypothetical protein